MSGSAVRKRSDSDFPRWLSGDLTRYCGKGYHDRCKGIISTIGIECACLCACHAASRHALIEAAFIETWQQALAMIPSYGYSIRLDGSATGHSAAVIRHDGPPIVVCHALADSPTEALAVLIRKWQAQERAA